MIDYNTFAEKIKQKYPEHTGEDNYSLAKRYIDQYPVYKNRVSLDQPTGAPEQSGLDKFISGPVIPGVGGVIGGIGGTMVAPGPGTVVGATGGTLAGSALQNTLKNMLSGSGVLAPTANQASQQLQSAGTNTGAAFGLSSVLGGLINLLNPGWSRQITIGGKTVPSTKLEQGTGDILNRNLKEAGAPADVAGASRSRLTDLMGAINPTDVRGGQSNVGINDIYKTLNKFETMGKAYQGSNPTAQATELASRATREFLNKNIPMLAQILNKYMTLANKVPTLGKIALGGGGGLAGLYELSKLLKVNDALSQ